MDSSPDKRVHEPNQFIEAARAETEANRANSSLREPYYAKRMINALLPVTTLDIEEKVSTIFCRLDRLYVGLHNGTLLVYQVKSYNEETVNETQSIQSPPKGSDSANYTVRTNSSVNRANLREANLSFHQDNLILVKKHSRFVNSSIEAIDYLSNTNQLLVLSESTVQIFNYDTLAFENNLEDSKGASIIKAFTITCPETKREESVVAIGIKRKLNIYRWYESELQYKKSFDLADRVKAIELLDDETLIIGLVSEFMSMSLSNFEIQPLSIPTTVSLQGSPFSYFGSSKIHIVKLYDYLLLSKDLNNVKLTETKEIVPSLVKFTSIPDFITFLFPYVIIISNKGIEVTDHETGSIFQHIPLIGVIGVSTINDTIFFTTINKVYNFKMTPFDKQLEQLSYKNDLTGSISLLNKLSDKEIDERSLKLRDLHIRKALALFDDGRYNESMSLFSDYLALPKEVLSLFPPFISGKPELSENSVFNDVSVNDLESDETSDTRSVISSRRDRPSVLRAQNSKKFRRALKNLLLYLTDARRIAQKLFTDSIEWKGTTITSSIYKDDIYQVAEDIDTSLFLCYLITNPSMIGPLLRVKNYSNSEIVKEKLLERRMYKELLDFYYNKSYHEESLTLLYNLGANKQDTFFKGAEATVQYLQKLNNDNLDLIFKFCKWPISIDPRYGSEIFMNDSLENESFDKVKVLEFLVSYDKSLAVEYIEHLIEDYNFKDPKFHAELCELYIDSILNSDEEDMSKSIGYSKLYTFLSTTSDYDPKTVLKLLPKTKKFLILHTLIYKKLKEHTKSLDIFVYELQAYDTALEYCSDIFTTDEIIGKRLLHKLLSKYLNPKKPHTPNHEQAKILLENQGSKMSILETLTALPSDFKVQDIQEFLTTQIRSFSQTAYTKSIEYNLNKVELVKLEEELLDSQQTSISITESKLCKVCGKKLGFSVLSFFPDNTVVHYGCAQKYSKIIENR